MKNLLLIAVFSLPLLVLAEENISINGVDEPAWKDFAPPAYVDVKAPKGLGKFNDTSVYWYKRKVEFENGIEQCRAIEANDAKFSCYQQLKVKQYQKNSDYNARLEAINNAKMVPQEMYDRTNNMIPLGSQINNFMRYQPNEFN